MIKSRRQCETVNKQIFMLSIGLFQYVAIPYVVRSTIGYHTITATAELLVLLRLTLPNMSLPGRMLIFFNHQIAPPTHIK